MKKILYLVIVFQILFILKAKCQLYFPNPSFELDSNDISITPTGWYSCFGNNMGNIDYTTFTNWAPLTTPPPPLAKNGKYYSAISNTGGWQTTRQGSTKLSKTFIAGKKYNFNFFARTPWYNLHLLYTWFDALGRIKISLGKNYCDKSQYILTTAYIDTARWDSIYVAFIPSDTFQYITFEVEVATADSVNHVCEILIDGFSPIYEEGVGVEAISANEVLNVEVYPNPTTNLLIIQSANMLIETVAVYDVMGRKLENLTIRRLENERHLQLDVSSLASGIYFVKVMDKQGKIKTAKFVKE